MNTIIQITQTHFSVFVFDKSNNNPIKRMPVYAEIAIIGRKKQEPVDGSLIVLSIDIPADAPVKQWITEFIEKYMGAAYWNTMSNDDKKTFISKLTEKIKNGFFAMPNENKQALVAKVIKSLASELDIPTFEQSPFETIAAYPLGLLATDHVGYLSYDLRRVPQNPYPLFQDQQYAFYVYPMGKENARIDALMQGRITPNVILAKLEIEKPLFEANLKALNLPAMQNPDLADWYMSPGSFAALPSALIGADGCENLFPGNFATQEFRFRQVVRLTAADSPAGFPSNYRYGYLDEYKVSLMPIGHSLGEIKYSLPLAPGESVKLAIIDWSRTDVSARTEDNTLKEQLYHNQMRDRTITETATAALREMQSGNSGIDKSNFSAGKALSGGVSGAAAGFAVGGPFGAIAGALIGGAGGGLTGDIKGTHSTSTGSKDVAAKNVQKLTDSFSQASSVLKEYHSTVVMQARHEEKESIETRTFTNYNHSHTLTILYYEILRHFKLVTEWVNRKPVALLPYDKINFDDIMAFHKPLIEANLLDMSLKAGFDAMEKLELLNIQYKNDGISDPNNPPLPAAPYWEGDMKFKLFEFGIKLHGDNEAKSPNDIKIYVRLTNGSEIPLLYLKEFDKLTDNINDSSRYNYDVNDDWSYFILQTDRSVPALNSDPNGETPIIRWRDIAGFQFEKSASIPQDPSNLLHILSLEIRAISTNNSWVQLYPNPTSEINVENQRDVNWRFAGNGTNIQTVTIIKRPSVRPPMPEKIKTPSQLLSPSEHLLIKKLKNHLSAFSDYYSRLIELSKDINDRAEEFEIHSWGNTPQNDYIIDHVEPITLEVFGSRIAYPLIKGDKFSAVILKEIYDNIKSNDPEKNQLALEQMKKFSEHDFENLAVQIMQTRATTEKLISFPTKGIFAEGKLGHCNISEEIDNTRFWKWEEHPIPINAPDINPVTAVTPQNTQQNVQPTSFPSSTVNIVSPSPAPDPQGLAEALKLIATPNIFRDMSGRQETADLIKKLGDGSIDFNDAVKKAKEIEAKYGKNSKTNDSSESSALMQIQGISDSIKSLNGYGSGSKLKENADKALDAFGGLAELVKQQKEQELAASFRNILAEVKKTVPRIKQGNENACWATAATIMVSWEKGKVLSVPEVLTVAGDSFLQKFTKGEGLKSSEKEAFLTVLDMIGEAPASYPLQQYIDWVKTYGPLWVTTDSSKADGAFSPHARILIRIEGTGTPDGNSTNFIFNDPATGTEVSESFTTFLKVYEQMVTDNASDDLFIQIVHFKEPILNKETIEGSSNSSRKLTDTEIMTKLNQPVRSYSDKDSRDIFSYLLRTFSDDIILMQNNSTEFSGIHGAEYVANQSTIMSKVINTETVIVPKAYIIKATINGVTFKIKNTNGSKTLDNIPPKMAILLYKLTLWLKGKYKSSIIYHLGIGHGGGNLKDQHNIGHSVDFAGVMNDNQDIFVLENWGQLPDVPTDRYRLENSDNSNGQFFSELYDWLVDEVMVTNNLQEIFGKNDINRPVLNKNIDVKANQIIHPDYPRGHKMSNGKEQRVAHIDHIHFQVNGDLAFWKANPIPKTNGGTGSATEGASSSSANPIFLKNAAQAFFITDFRDLDNLTTDTKNQPFFDWFAINIAGKGMWKDYNITDKTQFELFWDSMPNFLGGEASLVEVAAMTSIFLNETRSKSLGIEEGVGGVDFDMIKHSGLSWPFESFQIPKPGKPNESFTKASYNIHPNKKVSELLLDNTFITAHGNLEPLNPNIRSLPSWSGVIWPDLVNPELGAHNALIQECDFYKFRGRGPIQITFRPVYLALISKIQNYTGSNPAILKFKALWLGQTADDIATKSKNADWSELFKSGIEIPMMSIMAHNQQNGGGYLPLSRNVDKILGNSNGSIRTLGTKISGRATYGDETFTRVMEFLKALE